MSVWSQCVSNKTLRPRSLLLNPIQIGLALLLVILAAWAAINWIETIHRVIRLYNPLPVEDYWRIPTHLENSRFFKVRELWHQHNEHRIVFPELFFVADMLWFHGEQLLPLAANLAAYFGCWILAVMALNSGASASTRTGRFGAAVSAIVIGCPVSAFVLSTAFLLNWTLTQFACCAGFLLLWRNKVTGGKFALWGAICAGVVASYSSANGLLVWPVLAIAARLLQLPRRAVLTLAASGILSIGIYFIGYHRTGTLHLGELLRHPIYTFEFLCAFLSMPFSADRAASFSIIAGLVCILLTCYFFLLARRNRLLHSAFAILCFGFFAFAILTALLTAVGRMSATHDKLFFAAKPVRYVTLPLLNWAFLVIAGLWIADRIRSKALLMLNTSLIAAILVFSMAPRLKKWERAREVEIADQQLATLDIENGVPDLAITKSIFPNLAFVTRFSRVLQLRHLSIYHNGPAEWLGTPISEFLNDFGPAQNGALTFTFPVNGGLELAGTANIPPYLSLTDPQIVFFNAQGQLIGFGRHLRAGVPHQLAHAWPAAPLQWVGFVNLSFDARSVRAYLVTGPRLFPLEIQIPAIAPFSPGARSGPQSMDALKTAASTPRP